MERTGWRMRVEMKICMFRGVCLNMCVDESRGEGGMQTGRRGTGN